MEKISDFWSYDVREICREIYYRDVSNVAKYDIYLRKYPNLYQEYPEAFRTAIHPNTIKTDIINAITKYKIPNEEAKKLNEIYESDFNAAIDAYKRRFFGTKYPTFKYYKPNIFKKVCNPKCEFEQLLQWIDLVEKVEKGEMTQEDASYSFGDMIQRNYIPNTIKPNDKKDYQDEQYNMKYKIFSKKYPQFASEFPVLFNTVCDSKSSYWDIKNILDTTNVSEDTKASLKLICTEIYKYDR